MRLTGIVEDGNSAVAVQLDFKNESGESNGDLALSAIMGGTNSGKVFLRMLTEASRQAFFDQVKRTRTFASAGNTAGSLWPRRSIKINL
jgi:hypothetical protein